MAATAVAAAAVEVAVVVASAYSNYGGNKPRRAIIKCPAEGRVVSLQKALRETFQVNFDKQRGTMVVFRRSEHAGGALLAARLG